MFSNLSLAFRLLFLGQELAVEVDHPQMHGKDAAGGSAFDEEAPDDPHKEIKQ